MSSDGGPTLLRMAEAPTRIDLLELDIDLRLADLWREAAGISEWSLDVVADFMRASVGNDAAADARLDAESNVPGVLVPG